MKIFQNPLSRCARYNNSNNLIADLNMDHSDSETEELSPEQIEVLVQLQEITGLEDMAVCRALLESSNWDLESVAREQLGLLGNTEEAEVSDSDQGETDRGDQQPAGAVARYNTLSWLLYIITIPNRIIQGGFNIVWSRVSSIFGMQAPGPVPPLQGQDGDRGPDPAVCPLQAAQLPLH